jgi:type IV secretion system protein VirB2
MSSAKQFISKTDPLRLAFLVLGGITFMYLMFASNFAFAADTTGGGGAGLPWEGPMDKLRQSISGPVAFIIALLGVIACGATLIWGGEISEFTRRIIYIVLVICLIVFANTLLTGALFSGATIPANGLSTAVALTGHTA